MIKITYDKINESKENNNWRLKTNFPGMVYRCKNDDQWTIEFVNQGCYKLTGYRQKNFINNKVVSYNQIIVAEYRDYVRNKLTEAFAEKRDFEIEYQILTKNDEKKWVSEKGQGIYTDDGDLSYVEGFISDITEKKQAKKKLAENEAKFKTLFNKSPLSYMVFNEEGTEIINANTKAIKSYGCSSLNELKNHNKWCEPPYSYHEARKMNKKAIEEGPQQFEWLSKKKNDELFWEHVHLRTIEIDGVKRVVAMSVDITERKQAEEGLKKKDRKLERLVAVLKNSKDYIGMIDLEGNPIYHNPAAFEMLGYEKEEKLIIDNVHPVKEAKKIKNEILPQVKKEGYWEGTNKLVDKAGNIIPVRQTIFTVEDKSGDIFALATIMRDITAQKEYERKLEKLSLYDQLTEIYNRFYFEKELQSLEAEENLPISIISADIDGLKLINDTLGHEFGDKLLQDSVQILENVIRSSDTLARIGGDEFAILLPDTSEKDTKKIIKRIKTEITAYNDNSPKTPISISVGSSTAKERKQSLKEVLKKADDAMYLNKLEKSGKVKSSIMSGLMVALKERDYILEGHTRRVNELVQKMAEKLDLSATKQENLRLLAQVHDLGKVGIPDEILFKEEPLTEQEWQTMKQHPEIGYRIASSSSEFGDIADLILKHHESFDGTGYPLAIAGKSIPIEDRILAIVDSFDAMTNDRHYSQAISNREAIKELKRCSGKQFDPELIEIFLSLIE